MLTARNTVAPLVFAFIIAGFACNTADLVEPTGIPHGDAPVPDGGYVDSATDDADVDTTDDGAVSKDGAPKPDGGTSPYSQAVSVIVEPSDNAAALLAAIKAATKSIHVTMYLLSNDAIIKALTDKHAAGVEVKVILNKTFPANAGSNSASKATLAAAGVPVIYSQDVTPIYTYTHEKCVIIDGTSAWIMTMNVTQSSPTANREYLVLDTDADDVGVAEEIFKADYAGTQANDGGKLVVAPLNAKARLRAFVSGATTSLDIEAEEFSDTDVTADLVARADAGVIVRMVLADSQQEPTTGQAQAIASLKAHPNISIVQVHAPYIHAKAVVVDGSRAYVGSENFTNGSLTGNRELGVLFDTASEVQKVSTTIAADFAIGTPL